MKLKRFTAPDIRQAMTKVRAELGGDAVILSNRKTDDGIEIIAATDYDDAVLDVPDAVENHPAKNASTASHPPYNAPSMKTQRVIKAKKNTRQAADPLSAENTRNLAQHLAEKMDIKKPSPASRWKEALDDEYEDDSAELEALLNLDSEPDIDFAAHSRRGSNQSHNQRQKSAPAKKRSQPAKQAATANQTQVSSEWINQFSSTNEIETPTPAVAPIAAKEKTQDMENVWNELSSLRGLLETQLSSLAWTDVSKRHPVKSKTLRHMLEMGLTPEMSYELLAKVSDDEGFEVCWRKSLAMFAKRMPTTDDDMIKKGGVFALVGPTGVGKTTTIAKMAARYALTHGTGSIALVTTDSYRIGAQEQLRTYGRILGTPVKIANNAAELRQVLKSLYDKDLVLIDTAGTSQRDLRLTEQFSMLSEGSSLIKTYLVLSASSQQQVLAETVDAYKKVHLDGCVLTKLDESITLGGALSTIVQNKLPLAYISDGQRVPEDLHMAKAVELVKKSVSMMNNAQIKLDDNVLEMAFGRLAAHDLS